MASELLSKWLSWWQPMSRGLSEQGVANGLLLTGGWFWARIRGGYLLYCGCGDRSHIDWGRPVGAAGFDAREVHEFGWMERGPAGSYWYGVRVVGPGGMETGPGAEAIGCSVDGDGRPVGGLPGAVERLWAQPWAEGRVMLCWCYGAEHEAGRASEFRVYCSDSTGEVDYGRPVGNVEWDLRRPVYCWLSGPYETGARVRFGVCAANAAGEAAGLEVEVVIGGGARQEQGVMGVERVPL